MAPAPAPAPSTAPAPAPAAGPRTGAIKAEKATVVVEVPADAKLFVDDKVTKTEGTTRSFSTPELTAGQEYYYVVRAEVARDGKPVSETKRVTVKAGEVAKTSFTSLGKTEEVKTASK